MFEKKLNNNQGREIDFKRELEETKNIFEIKLQARVRELEEITRTLEDKVKARTAEYGARTKELEESKNALMNILEDVEGARERAEEERNKTLAIITNFTDGLMLFDEENNLSLVNIEAENLFGIKGKEIIGLSADKLYNIAPISPLIETLGREIKKTERKELSIRNLILEVSSIPVEREGNKVGTLVVLHNITREKIVEKLKTEFVSIAAHQLRTPLSAIKWSLRMLLDGDLGKMSDEQKKFVDKTYLSNERMISLINSLLDVTRIEEGRYLYKPILVDIVAVAESVIKFYKDESEKRSVTVKLLVPEGKIPKVMVDDEKIRLAFQNLIDNAIKYTPAGGVVTVSIKYDKKEIRVSVKDDGVGIPKEQQGRVFNKFFRGVNVMRMDTEGTGLGLFIVRNVIEAHGGEIWFESEENKGSTFSFSLPVKEEFGEFLKEL